MFTCIANFVHFWQVFGYNEHIETVQLDDHIYHLQFYSYDPAEAYSAYYFLYECDSLDLLCYKIYSIPQTTGGITPDVEEIALVPDIEANTLSVQVNGEIVYTHHP
jgi:hypothetical protein